MHLDWDESAKASAYYEELSEAIKDKMIPEPPSNFQELVNLSIQLDNRLYERRIEKAGWHSRYKGTGGRHWETKNRGYGDPMNLDAMQEGKRHAPRDRRERGGRPSDKEKERRKRENLCYNCGGSGHIARNCEPGARSLHMMNEETDSVAKKADTTEEISKATEGKDTAQRGYKSATEKANDFKESQRTYDVWNKLTKYASLS
jgi:hypothetical protein